MKIIFESEYPSHGRLIFDTDWTFAKKILDMIWADMTIDAFDTVAQKEIKERLKAQGIGEKRK